MNREWKRSRESIKAMKKGGNENRVTRRHGMEDAQGNDKKCQVSVKDFALHLRPLPKEQIGF